MSIATANSIIAEGKEKQAIAFILENCFRAGFGTMNKSELDLILFSALLKYSDISDTTDYALSKYLQITQARVRNLKEKVSVKYLPTSREDAIFSFVEKAASAKLEETYIDIPIFDIAVKNEIEAILTENNIMLYSQLNPKIFRLRIDDFLELAILFESEVNPDKSREEIESNVISVVRKLALEDKNVRARIPASDKQIRDLSKSTLKEALVKGGMAFGIDLLASLIPGGAFISTPVKNLLNTIQRKL